MLLYNKAHDPYHTLFRLLNIIINHGGENIEHDRLRIYDFLVAFPVHISKMSLKRELQKQKTPFKRFASAYNIFDPYFLFESMRPIQDAVIGNLLKTEILQQDANNLSYVIHKESFTKELLELTVNIENSSMLEVVDFINVALAEYELFGPDGLKSASHLMEFRYDAIQANTQN
ncbi:ABC-three component system middle component 5 [Chromobacterium subtsugae]|uniref:ABC-three component system middle component 5 n=1 Tax=Chromobacterium subtsugae TaxID=251747 RepID=UPI000B071F5B|nr:ABC-three component system middle component 5 [Chromobacterium subtsugae]